MASAKPRRTGGIDLLLARFRLDSGEVEDEYLEA